MSERARTLAVKPVAVRGRGGAVIIRLHGNLFAALAFTVRPSSGAQHVCSGIYEGPARLVPVPSFYVLQCTAVK